MSVSCECKTKLLMLTTIILTPHMRSEAAGIQTSSEEVPAIKATRERFLPLELLAKRFAWHLERAEPAVQSPPRRETPSMAESTSEIEENSPNRNTVYNKIKTLVIQKTKQNKTKAGEKLTIRNAKHGTQTLPYMYISHLSKGIKKTLKNTLLKMVHGFPETSTSATYS